MENVCKNYEKCPIYSGILVDQKVSAASYKRQYCEAGSDGWNKCKRYMVKEKCGQCPSDLLPNSFRDIDSIISTLNLN